MSSLTQHRDGLVLVSNCCAQIAVTVNDSTHDTADSHVGQLRVELRVSICCVQWDFQKSLDCRLSLHLVVHPIQEYDWIFLSNQADILER
jgi:hypothetical protein